MLSQCVARIPLQSRIGSEEPIRDSFSPGEAMGAPAPENIDTLKAPGKPGAFDQISLNS